MSQLHIFRIAQYLHDEFENKIDLSNFNKKFSAAEQKKAFLSRAQCALAIKYLAGIDTDIASNSITDGYGDNGIDGIFTDFENKILYLCQSKWIENGNTVPSRKEIVSFLRGIDDLISIRFNKFNDIINLRKSDITKCLRDAQFKIHVALVYTSTQEISGEALEDINQTLSGYNDTNDTFEFTQINQKDLYKALLVGKEKDPINLKEVTLYNWGKHEHPFEAIYGEIEAEQLAVLWKEYKQDLVDKNLRLFKNHSNVNDLLKHTLVNSPENFWYFNNGITVLCKGIGKGGLHGNDRSAGVFSFSDVSIVNGAQTLGSIGDTYINYPDSVKQAKVLIRFINLNNAPEGFEKKITRYNNTQNKIENKDFAALDPEQSRIKQELLLDKKEYIFKSGEIYDNSENASDIEEVTYSLACAFSDINLSVIAHRNIGSIWLDIERPPYNLLFNSKTTGLKVWRAVSIRRITNLRLQSFLFEDNLSLIATHGDAFILYKVFEIYGRNKLENQDPSCKINQNEIIDIVNKVISRLEISIPKHFSNIYLNNLFKNKEKVELLSKDININLGIEKDLFNK